MRYHERLNIIFMRDNGPRHSIRMRRSRFYLMIVFFLCLPFLCILLAVQCWFLWQSNVKLQANVDRFEADYQVAEARAERLENLEELLREENVPGREILISHIATDKTEPHESPVPAQNGEENVAEAEGPGHEEFPAVDNGRVKISNVQVRALRGNVLRIGLDLRNPENEQMLSGEVHASLITASGEEVRLLFVPENIGSFRINRFKRTVITAHAPRSASLDDARIILEVKNQSGEVLYRNIFAVQH